MFKKAERKKSKLRLALCGTSGSGKTRGAILIAKGMGGKIAMIDTERGSGQLYDTLADFDVCELSAPFSPQRYINAIKYAEKEGYTALIIDSLSHAWSGEGGVLDMQDKATKASSSKNSYYAWRDVTPHHNLLVDAILQSSMHIICCMRSKASYEVSTGSNGKPSPVKIGLAPIQREGMEYEFTVVLDLDSESHLYTSSKDRTTLFNGKHEEISEETGERLVEWLNHGREDSIITIDDYIKLISSAKDLNDLKEYYMQAINKYKDFEHEINKIVEEKNKTKQILISQGENNAVTLSTTI